jgi:hypothetical protein
MLIIVEKWGESLKLLNTDESTTINKNNDIINIQKDAFNDTFIKNIPFNTTLGMLNYYFWYIFLVFLKPILEIISYYFDHDSNKYILFSKEDQVKLKNKIMKHIPSGQFVSTYDCLVSFIIVAYMERYPNIMAFLLRNVFSITHVCSRRHYSNDVMIPQNFIGNGCKFDSNSTNNIIINKNENRSHIIAMLALEIRGSIIKGSSKTIVGRSFVFNTWSCIVNSFKKSFGDENFVGISYYNNKKTLKDKLYNYVKDCTGYFFQFLPIENGSLMVVNHPNFVIPFSYFTLTSAFESLMTNNVDNDE